VSKIADFLSDYQIWFAVIQYIVRTGQYIVQEGGRQMTIHG